MNSFIQLFVIALAIGTICGQQLNVTTDVQDYGLLAKRELLTDIERVELRIASVNARYADRLEVIQTQQQQLLQEIHNVNNTLMPMQAIGLFRKHCIQKFDSQLVTYDNAKLLLKTCYDRAVVTGNTLTASPQANVANAKSNVINTLPSRLSSCDSSYANKNQTALELCYIREVNTVTTNVNYYLDSANDQLDKALYDAQVASKTAVTCSFLVEKDSLETIGQTTRAIDDCEAELKKQNKDASVLAAPKQISVQKLIGGKIAP